MRKRFCILLFLPFAAMAQADMRLYTVAGGPVSGPIGDGGPAAAAYIDNTEGIWVDGSCNLYLSDMQHKRIRKVDIKTGIITTIAGNGSGGFAGDGGLATDAMINAPYGLFSDISGNIYFADAGNYRVRKIDAASGIITTFAGGGTVTGDGGPAISANIGEPFNCYGDKAGNIYIAADAKIRKVSTSGIITTIAGTGISGISGDNGPATNAMISKGAAGRAIDVAGNLLFADRGNARIRKISATTHIITTVAGSTDGFSGDGGQATAAQLSGPISIFFDYLGNLIIGDNQNDVIRKVDTKTNIITTIAGNGLSVYPKDTIEGLIATACPLHPEFIYIDLDGNIYFSNYSNRIHKIINYLPGLSIAGSSCTKTNDVPSTLSSKTISIYPNPVNDELHIDNVQGKANYSILNITGQTVQQGTVHNVHNVINVENMANGLYLLSVTDEQGKRMVCKFVKQ